MNLQENISSPEEKNQTENNSSQVEQQQTELSSEKKFEIYEKSKFKKSLLCKLCGKSYTQNSGIYHHQKDKHGFFSSENVEEIFPKQEKVKRGRPKLILLQQQQNNNNYDQEENQLNNNKKICSIQNNSDSQIDNQQQQNNENSLKNEDIQSKQQKNNNNNNLEFTLEELRENGIDFQDLDLDFLQNENIKMILSVIIEYGEPNKTRKYNNLYNEFDDMNPYGIKQNTLSTELWPEIFKIYEQINPQIIDQQQNQTIVKKSKAKELIQQDTKDTDSVLLKDTQVIKIKNLASKIIQDVKGNTVVGFIAIFKIIFDGLYGKLQSEINSEEIQKNILNQIHFTNQKTQNNLNPWHVLASIEHAQLSLELFVQYFVNSSIAYVYDDHSNEADLTQYFGN